MIFYLQSRFQLPKKLNLLFFAVACCLPIENVQANESNFLKIVTLVNPEEKPELFNLFERINSEICRRIQHQCSFTFAPGARASAMVEHGEADGENYRIFDFSKDGNNPHHVRVDAALYTASFNAWGKPTAPKVNSWNDLIVQNKEIIYIFGSKMVTNNLTEKMGVKLMFTYTAESALKMLTYDRATYFITSDSYSVENLIKQLNLKEAIVKLGTVENTETFMYLNDKHQTLVPKMKLAIEQMKKDGTLNALLQESGKQQTKN